jgi:hypothetical protein
MNKWRLFYGSTTIIFCLVCFSNCKSREQSANVDTYPITADTTYTCTFDLLRFEARGESKTKPANGDCVGIVRADGTIFETIIYRDNGSIRSTHYQYINGFARSAEKVDGPGYPTSKYLVYKQDTIVKFTIEFARKLRFDHKSQIRAEKEADFERYQFDERFLRPYLLDMVTFTDSARVQYVFSGFEFPFDEKYFVSPDEIKSGPWIWTDSLGFSLVEKDTITRTSKAVIKGEPYRTEVGQKCFSIKKNNQNGYLGPIFWNPMDEIECR